MRRLTVLLLLLAVACESKVEKYQRLESERDAASTDALVAMRRWETLKATGAPIDSQTHALSDAITADMRRKDLDVEMRLMMGGR